MTLSDLHCCDRLLLSALHCSQNKLEVFLSIIEMDLLIFPKNMEGLFKMLLRHNYSRFRNTDKCWLEYDEQFFTSPSGCDHMKQTTMWQKKTVQ
jgi:hypothetical protein